MKKRNKFLRQVKYLLESILFLFSFHFFRLFSVDKSSFVAGKIAELIGPKLKVSKTAKKNLEFALPNLNDQEHFEIIKKMWNNLGRVAGEFPFMYNYSEEELRQRVRIINGDILERLKAEGKACLFFSGHIGNWEVSPRIPKLYGFELGLVYRHANNKFVDNQITKERKKQNIDIIAKGSHSVRNIVTKLQNGMSIAMLVDQKMNDGIDVPFFGRNAKTAHAIAKLAIKYNANIVPARVSRTNGANYDITFFEPLKFDITDKPGEDIYNIMVNINKILEDWIKEKPEEWFWVHQRWPK